MRLYDAIICAQKFARDPSELSATKGTLPAGPPIVSKLHYQTQANSDEFFDWLKYLYEVEISTALVLRQNILQKSNNLVLQGFIGLHLYCRQSHLQL